MTRANLATAIGVLVASLAAACGAGERPSDREPRAASDGHSGGRVTPRGNYTLAEARTFDEFTVYYVGDEFAGLPLTAVLRRKDKPVAEEPITANSVSFVYGDCTPTGDAGCPPPLVITTWPACERSLADYELYPGTPLPHKRLTVRGAPAARFADRLEVYTGDATVIVNANRDRDLLRAANALVAVNEPARDGRSLPPPVPGALDGTLACEEPSTSP